MSHYDWEHGTIKLPSAAASGVKKAVRDASNRSRDQAKALAKTFWQDHAKRTRSSSKYRAAVDQYMHGLYKAQEPRGWSTPKPPPCNLDDLHWMLNSIADHPRQVTEADLDRCFGEKATNRTNTFQVGEASITFDGNNVTWSVPENNHAVEHARRHPVSQAFFAALQRVSWTRGTGGEIVGNNEYNRDNTWAGGGANYVTDGYGPLGDPTRRLGRSMQHARTRATHTGRDGRGSNQYQRR